MKKKPFFKKIIRDRAFYAMVLSVALPVIAQNGISQFVNVLDNLMVGSMGTEQMSGVAIANQLIFVFDLFLFGGLSGPGIFGAQFFGRRDTVGLRSIFRMKLVLCGILCTAFMGAFALMPEPLVRLFLHESGEGHSIEETLRAALSYLAVMQLGHIPYALSMAMASSMRECRETMLPMKASVAAVAVNLTGNWLLIGGNLGCPALGVTGAAIATVVSRYVEFGILLIPALRNRERFFYLGGVFARLHIRRSFLKSVVLKSLPLLINEGLWALGMTTLNAFYSLHGLTAVAAINIHATVNDLFAVVFLSIGSSIGIIVGNLLGEGKLREARDTDTGMIAFSVGACFLMGLLLAVAAPFFPRLYNTTADVRETATRLLLVTACLMPLHAFNHGTYFTLRTGGLTGVTLLFDSGYTWAIAVPAALLVCKYTSLSLLPCFIIVSCMEFLKAFAGFFMVKSDRWLRTIEREE